MHAQTNTGGKPPPAFLWYAGDFLSDPHVHAMTYEERGVYITLLSMAWKEEGIPADLDRVAAWLGITRRKLDRIWPALSDKWEENTSGKLTNPRLEAEREKQRLWREKSAKGGRKGKGGSRVVKPHAKHASESEKRKVVTPSTDEVRNGSVAREVLAEFNACAGTKFTSNKFLAMIRKRVAEHPELTIESHRGIIMRNLAAPWWEGTPSPSVIYGSEEQFERAMHANGQGKRHPADLQVERFLRMAETA